MSESRSTALTVCGAILAATIGMFVGVLTMRPAGRRSNPVGWRDFIRGEWWITSEGEAIEVGSGQEYGSHEAYAAERVFDRDALVEALGQGYDKKTVVAIIRLARMAEHNRGEPDSILTREVLAKALRDPPLCRKGYGYVERARLSATGAFIVGWGAIRVCSGAFALDRLDEDTFDRIQGFLLETIDVGKGYAPDKVYIDARGGDRDWYEFTFEDFVSACSLAALKRMA